MQYIDLAFAEEVAENEKERPFLAWLMASARAGHLCVSVEGKQTIPEIAEEIRDAVLESAKTFTPKPNGPIIKEGNHYYLARNHFFEKRMERSLLALLSKKHKELTPENLSSQLTEEQKEAVIKGLRAPFLVLTGGPGCGKTFTAAHLIYHYLQQTGGRVLLTAPTGRAASKLLESVAKLPELAPFAEKMRCATLHSLLGVRSPKDFFAQPAYLEADLILVDEASMIDARLFSLFLQAMAPKTRLILMGDGDQLPPVEAGDLFTRVSAHIKEKNPQNYSELTICMRSDRLDLLKLADSVRRGDAEEALRAANLQPLPADLKKPILQNFPKPTKTPPDPQALLSQLQQFRILTPLREGRFGVEGIGKQALEILMREMEPPYFFAYPILVTKNAPDQNLYNGEAGVLIREVKERGAPLGPYDRAYFPGDKEVAALLLPPHEVGYALSVHKSQGSEFDEVLLLLPPGSERFSREILYTGITRARQLLSICGDEQIFCELLAKHSKRHSNLFSRILG